MRVPWAARKSNQSILKEISPVYVCDVKKDTAVIISEYLNFDPLLFYLLYCLDGIFTRVNHFFPLHLEGRHSEMRETVSSRV